MNKDCEEYAGLIEDLIAGEELDVKIAAQIEAHISDCAECCNEYELQRREKEVFARFLFDFEPPTNSWANLQARLNEEETVASNLIPDESSRRKRRFSAFGFSPAFAALAILFLVLGGAFIKLKNASLKTDDIVETKPQDFRQFPQITKDEPKPTNALQKKNVDLADQNAPKDIALQIKNPAVRATNKFPTSKKSLATETLKIKQKAVPSGAGKSFRSETALNDETQPANRQRENFETEIAGQIEKVELLLRSFRNARKADEAASFDVEYEKRQARKLLEINAFLRRDAEIYETAYAEELLSRVEPYLLEIANLGNDPAPEKVLDIKKRVNNQNIIASLQVYCCTADQ